MSIQNQIEQKLDSGLTPQHMQVENESHMHGGPATESHFKITLVSDEFSKLARVKRHQTVYAILAEELAGQVHALALHLYSPDEWQTMDENVPASPDCRGGSKAAL